MTLADHLRTSIVAALESIPAGDRPDIYVVSLYVSDVDDDPRRPTITAGYNTERQVAACTPAPGQKPRWPIASDAAEARWNYAVVIGSTRRSAASRSRASSSSEYQKPRSLAQACAPSPC